MDISNETIDGVAVVRVRGNMDTNTAGHAQTHLDALLAEGSDRILIDFEELDYISSAGLRVLLATAKKLRSSGGSLRLCTLNDTVAEIFEISGFSTIFTLFDSREQALEAF